MARTQMVMIPESLMLNFEHIFLTSGDKQLKIEFNPSLTSFKHTISEVRTDTIGSKYPFIRRNGNIDYVQFPLGGFISSAMDESGLFTSKLEVFGDYLDKYNPLNGLVSVCHVTIPFRPCGSRIACHSGQVNTVRIVEHRILLGQELKNGGFHLTSVTDIVKLTINIIIEGCPSTSKTLILKLEIVIREVATLCLHRHVLQHDVLLGDGDELLSFRNRFILSMYKHIRSCRHLQAGFHRTDITWYRRDLTIHSYTKRLLLVIDAGVEEHLPFSIHEWQTKHIITILVRSRVTRQTLSLLVIKNQLQIHIIDRIALAVFV